MKRVSGDAYLSSYGFSTVQTPENSTDESWGWKSRGVKSQFSTALNTFLSLPTLIAQEAMIKNWRTNGTFCSKWTKHSGSKVTQHDLDILEANLNDEPSNELILLLPLRYTGFLLVILDNRSGRYTFWQDLKHSSKYGELDIMFVDFLGTGQKAVQLETTGASGTGIRGSNMSLWFWTGSKFDQVYGGYTFDGGYGQGHMMENTATYSFVSVPGEPIKRLIRRVEERYWDNLSLQAEPDQTRKHPPSKFARYEETYRWDATKLHFLQGEKNP